MAREQAPIPMYPDEDRIAVEVMGPARAKEWPSKARYLEDKHGLPPVDELMGGRFWPAVVEYFKTRHGIALPPAVDGVSNSKSSARVRLVPFKPDGKESFDGPETQRPDGRRHRSRDHRSRL
ncbi:hypothetical protein [Tardiphaga sp. P5_C7]